MEDTLTLLPRNKFRTSCAVKHDKLPWTVGCSFLWYGTSAGFRTNNEDVLKEVMGKLGPDAQPIQEQDVDLLFSILVGKTPTRRGVQNYHIYYQDWVKRLRSLDLPQVVRDGQALMMEDLQMLTKSRSTFRGHLLAFESDHFWLPDTETEDLEKILAELPGSRLIKHGTPPLVWMTDEATMGTWSHPKEIVPNIRAAILCNPEDAKEPAEVSPGKACLRLVQSATASRYWPETILPRLGAWARSHPTFEAGSSHMAAAVRKAIE
ncbi:MAG: hypothetical protein KF760_05125 [Candidatus Eremiobacteraeota bacterium]|nr:hypothetical protein [Candidatus Eremiobacteraeota bacterium]